MNICKQSNNKAYLLIAYICTFILLYNPQIYGFPTQRILYPFSLIYFFLTGCKLYDKEKKLLLIALLCVCIGFSNALIQTTNDFGMLLISRAFFGVLCSNMIFNFVKKANCSINETTSIKLIGYTGIFQALIVVVSFFIPEIKSLLLEFNTVSGERDNVMFHLSLVRGIGWGTFQYAHMAILLGSSLICYIYLVTVNRHTKFSKIVISLILLVYVIAGILAARTFFIILGLLSIYWFSIYIKSHNIIKFFKILTVVILTIISIGTYVYIKLKDYISEDTINWAFEFLINFLDKGKLESGSTNVLASMWHFPDNLKTWLFGDARSAGLNGNYNYTLSDIGFINSLYYWGLIGSFFYFLCLFKSFEYAANLSVIKKIKYLIWLIFLVNIGYQFKETLNLFPISCLFLRGQILTNYKKNRRILIRK